MSEKRINIIIVFIVIISIIASFLLMKYSPKNREVNEEKVKIVDKIKAVNSDIDRNFSNNNGYFTINLDNYDLAGVNISVDINVRKLSGSVYTIDNVKINDNVIDVKLNKEIIDFDIGVIKENNKSVFLYLTTNKGTQDGEGDTVIVNNNGNILYQNNSSFMEELDDYKYLVKEKYVGTLIGLTCKDSKLDEVAFKNITYKSINGQLVNINFEELKVSDVCYNE